MSTTNLLNPKYFELIQAEGDYQAYRPKGNPIVLFSKTKKIPLACFHLKTQSTENQNKTKGNRGQAFLTKRWKQSPLQCDFQGIFTADDQEFKLVITNFLSNEMIKFEVLKATTDNPNDTSSMIRLNEVNSIRSFYTYSIQADKSNSCSLIFSTIKNKEGESCVTVKQEEELHKDAPKGTYYYLEINPEKGKEGEELYRDTYWECVDAFIIKTQSSKPVAKGTKVEDYSSEEESCTLHEEEGGEECCTNDGNGVYLLDSAVSTYELCETAIVKGSIQKKTMKDRVIPMKDNPNSKPIPMRGGEECCDTNAVITTTKKDTEKRRLSSVTGFMATSPAKRQKIDDSEVEVYTKNTNEGSNRERKNNEEKSSENPFIEMSLVGKVQSGRRIDEQFSTCYTDFSSSVVSAKCKIGLSVIKGLSVNRKTDEFKQGLRAAAVEEIQKRIDESFNDLFGQMKLHKEEDKCNVCGKKSPDTVLFQCGHKCMHEACISKANLQLLKCPWCDLFVTGKITT